MPRQLTAQNLIDILDQLKDLGFNMNEIYLFFPNSQDGSLAKVSGFDLIGDLPTVDKGRRNLVFKDKAGGLLDDLLS